MLLPDPAVLQCVHLDMLLLLSIMVIRAANLHPRRSKILNVCDLAEVFNYS